MALDMTSYMLGRAAGGGGGGGGSMEIDGREPFIIKFAQGPMGYYCDTQMADISTAYYSQDKFVWAMIAGELNTKGLAPVSLEFDWSIGGNKAVTSFVSYIPGNAALGTAPSWNVTTLTLVPDGTVTQQTSQAPFTVDPSIDIGGKKLNVVHFWSTIVGTNLIWFADKPYNTLDRSTQYLMACVDNVGSMGGSDLAGLTPVSDGNGGYDYVAQFRRVDTATGELSVQVLTFHSDNSVDYATHTYTLTPAV